MDRELQNFENWLNGLININREIDVEREIIAHSTARIEELEAGKERFASMISSLTPLHRQILYKRYILGQEWSSIARSLHYAEPTIYRLRKSAISEAYNVLKNDKVDSSR